MGLNFDGKEAQPLGFLFGAFVAFREYIQGVAGIAALFSMNRAPALEDEIARLKEENAALKGGAPEDEPRPAPNPPLKE